MNLKKVVAALSAVTMLGSLAAAVPASAKEFIKTDFQATADTTWYTKESKGNGQVSANGSSITLTSTSADDSNDIIQVRPVGCNSDGTLTLALSANVKYTVSVDYSADITSFNAAKTQNVVYGTFRAMTPKTATTGYDTVSGTNQTKAGVTGKILDNAVKKTDTLTCDITPSVDSYLEIQLYLRHCQGTVTYSNLKVTHTENVAADYVDSIALSADNAGATLYQGESITLTPTVIPADTTADVEYKFYAGNTTTELTGDTFKFDQSGTTFTYNSKDRVPAANNGQIDVVAVANGKESNKVTFYVQRQRHVAYNITNNTGETSIPGLTATSTINGVTNGFNNTAVTKFGELVQAGNGSGHSSYSLTFNVPEGYKLTLDAKDGCTISGNTISTNDGVDLNNDFYVEATLKKDTTTSTTTKYYTFEAENGVTYDTIVINATNDEVTQEGKASITAITGGSMFVEITNIPAGVTINSVTLK